MAAVASSTRCSWSGSDPASKRTSRFSEATRSGVLTATMVRDGAFCPTKWSIVPSSTRRLPVNPWLAHDCAARRHDGRPIVGGEFRLDEPPGRVPHQVRAQRAGMEVVEHDQVQPSVEAPGVAGDVGLDRLPGKQRLLRRLDGDVHQRESIHRLGDAVLENLEVGLRQIPDEGAGRVERPDIHLHQVHLDAEGDRRNVRGRRLLGGCDGQGDRHGQSRPAPAMCHWPHHSAPAGGTIRRKTRHAEAVSGAGAPELGSPNRRPATGRPRTTRSRKEALVTTRLHAFSIAATAVAASAAGGLLSAVLPVRAAAQAPPGIVTTAQVNLVDRAGRLRGVLSAEDERGMASLALFGPDGGPRAVLAAAPDGAPTFELYDRGANAAGPRDRPGHGADRRRHGRWRAASDPRRAVGCSGAHPHRRRPDAHRGRADRRRSARSFT